MQSSNLKNLIKVIRPFVQEAKQENQPHAMKNAQTKRIKSTIARCLLLALCVQFPGCSGKVNVDEKTISSGPADTTPVASGSTNITSKPTGTATLAWTAPSTNADGSPLTDLAGYRVYFGTTPGVYTSLDVGKVVSYEMGGLTKGQTYYFAVTAYNSSGNESDYSNLTSKLIN